MTFAEPLAVGLDPHARTDPRSSKLFAGRYLLGRELGRGGMGAVYSAFDTVAMRRVALKRIEPRPGQDVQMLEQRFRREIRALAACRNAGTPWLLHCELTDGATFYTMEIVAGEPLRGLLARERLDTVRALSLAIELGQILASIHAVGVVHRDVKPGNILIEAGDRVRLVDFGACAFLPHFFMREELEADKITDTVDRWATGDFDAVHTPGYSAPEIGREDAEVNVRNDIYSLCAVTYELVTGRPLFDKQVLRDRPIVAEEFGPELGPLAPLLASGASHETYERQRSMAELVQGLEISRTRAIRARTAARGRVLTTAALGLAAAAVLAAAWYGGESSVGPSAGSAAEVDRVAPPVSRAKDAARSGVTAEDEARALEVEPDPPGVRADADARAEAARDAPRAEAADRDGAAAEAPRAKAADHEVERRALASRQPVVQRCVDTEGGVLAELTVSLSVAAGRVDAVRLVRRDAPMLARCVGDALRGLRLPGPESARLLHTFRLRTPGRP